LVSSGIRIGRMGMIRITGIRNKKKNGHFKKWTENLPQVFFLKFGGRI